jgi:UDP-2,4-diacetamido-2,4,6-trideoxy-beta-L-altropyranose hydrolase
VIAYLHSLVVVFRADASAEIGTGHMMRSLALAQRIVEQGGRAIFVMGHVSLQMRKRLEEERCEVFQMTARLYGWDDVQELAIIAKENNAGWVFIDGYHFDAEYQRLCKKLGLRFVFVDDFGHADHYFADIILNQSLYAHKDLYRNREPYTRLLLGNRYVLLRKEFLHSTHIHTQIPQEAKHILVTLGGADISNVTRTVIETIHTIRSRDIETIVVVGGSNPNMSALQTLIAASPVPMQLLFDVRNMSQLMEWADLAVSAGGTTCYELAYMGVPTIALIIADNQVEFAERMDAAGHIKNLGRPILLTEGKLADELERMILRQCVREEMIRRQAGLVDGKGVERILMQLHKDMRGSIATANHEMCVHASM